jgi:hypothetical protein
MNRDLPFEGFLFGLGFVCGSVLTFMASIWWCP